MKRMRFSANAAKSKTRGIVTPISKPPICFSSFETYDGVAIMATNLRQKTIDEAFTRRLDFLIDFPFPDGEYRASALGSPFPARSAIGEGCRSPGGLRISIV